MILVAFADLHLDTAFAWASPATSTRRRRALRETLLRILQTADQVDADVILCGGDLYEQARFTPDTREFLRSTFAATHRRILIAPGNHDWFGPRSLYAQVNWSDNVHVFTEDRLQPVCLDDGVTLWGAAFTAPTRAEGFLDQRFKLDRGGLHLALFHGSERAGFRFEDEGKSPYAPFATEDVAQVGLRHAFVGHLHTPHGDEYHTYPGNPDPLTFGESGQRGVVVARVESNGRISIERRSVAVSEVHDLSLDLTGLSNSQAIRDAAQERLAGLAGVARLTLCGEVPPDAELSVPAIKDVAHGLDDLVVRAGDLHVGYDFDRIAQEPTVRGQFVRDIRASADIDEDERRRILVTGLRALDGRGDLEVV